MAKHLRIEGLVQGVGYRAAFAAEAKRLRVAGWVRNRRDGSVEALITGLPSAVDQMIAWARHGPPAARVSRIGVCDVADPEVSSETMTVLPTE